MPSPFTPDQLASLYLQIEQQLTELRDEPPALTRTATSATRAVC